MATQPVLPTTDWQLIADPWTDFNASSNYDIPLEWSATSANAPPASAGHLIKMDAGVSRQQVGGGYVWMRAVRQPVAALAVSTWPGKTIRLVQYDLSGLAANANFFGANIDLGLHRGPLLVAITKSGAVSSGANLRCYESSDGVNFVYAQKLLTEVAALSYDSSGMIYIAVRPIQRYLQIMYANGATAQAPGANISIAIQPGV